MYISTKGGARRDFPSFHLRREFNFKYAHTYKQENMYAVRQAVAFRKRYQVLREEIERRESFIGLLVIFSQQLEF